MRRQGHRTHTGTSLFTRAKQPLPWSAVSGLAAVDGLGSAAIIMGELRTGMRKRSSHGGGRAPSAVSYQAKSYEVRQGEQIPTCLTYLEWDGKGCNTLAHVGMAVVIALPDAPTLTHPPGRRCSSTSRLASARSPASVTAAQRPEKSHHLTQVADSVYFLQHTHKPTRCDGRLLLSARSLLSRAAAAAPPPLMVLCRTPVKASERSQSQTPSSDNWKSAVRAEGSPFHGSRTCPVLAPPTQSVP
ncbi:hypothetical protein EDB80DRAFT_779388 [Ilyonectria destructans]|nr:hypothetical protein EDB80DRAFT_779388 [Ilyonectria destructans]